MYNPALSCYIQQTIITIRRYMHEMCCFFAVRQLYVVKESDELRYTFNARPVYVRPTSENFLK